jgi:hypothetical protein
MTIEQAKRAFVVCSAVLVILAIAANPLSGQRAWHQALRPKALSTSDCYEPELVRSWVELPLGIAEGSSFLEQSIYWAGDRIAIGIMQGFTQKELLDRERLNRILSLVRLSFSQRKLITSEDSRNPRVTMLLLYFLEHEFRDKDTQKNIIETEQYVSSQAVESTK